MPQVRGFTGMQRRTPADVVAQGGEFNALLRSAPTAYRADRATLIRRAARWAGTFFSGNLEKRLETAISLVTRTADDATPWIKRANAFFQASAHAAGTAIYTDMLNGKRTGSSAFLPLEIGAKLITCDAALPLVHTWLEVARSRARDLGTVATAYELEGDALVSNGDPQLRMQALAYYARAVTAYEELHRAESVMGTSKENMSLAVSQKIARVLETEIVRSRAFHGHGDLWHPITTTISGLGNRTLQNGGASIVVGLSDSSIPTARRAVSSEEIAHQAHFQDHTARLLQCHDGTLLASMPSNTTSQPDALPIVATIGWWEPTSSARPALLAEFDRELARFADIKGPWLPPQQIEYCGHYTPDTSKYHEFRDARGLRHRLWIERDGSVAYQPPFTDRLMRIAAALPDDQRPARSLAGDLDDGLFGGRGKT